MLPVKWMASKSRLLTEHLTEFAMPTAPVTDETHDRAATDRATALAAAHTAALEEICSRIASIQHCLDNAKRSIGLPLAWPSPDHADEAAAAASEVCKQFAQNLDYSRILRAAVPDFVLSDATVDAFRDQVVLTIEESTQRI